MTFTPETYKARLIALHGQKRGAIAAWAREMGVNHSTILRQCNDEFAVIKLPYWKALHERDGKGYPEWKE